jgi:hypothetical protein
MPALIAVSCAHARFCRFKAGARLFATARSRQLLEGD